MIQMNWLKLLNKSLFISVLFIGINGFSQKTFQEYRTIYPDYNEIILNDNTSYDITLENKSVKIIQNNYNESMILTENGINNNSESFTYSELIKLIDFDAQTIINDKGKERKIKVTQTNEKESRDDAVFYNGVKERQLIFTNLEAGAKKVYQYKREFLDYHLLHKFIFGNSFPIVNSTLEIKTDKEINIGYKVFNDDANAIEFSKTEKKGKWIYKWTLKNIQPLKFESFAPGFLHIIPHIDIYIKDFTVDNTKVEGLENVEKLFNYYQTYTKNLNKEEDKELKEITLQVIADATSEEDKVKRIFYWVKDNIKYVAFENGYEGFKPREGALVCQRKFGDCKDMASIITAMAKYAGLKNVYLTWIGTREIPYSYSELATPAVDNHMIATYKKGDEYIFLDATDKETRYGIPTAFIQGKEALVNENNSYKIVKVPVTSAENNAVTDNVKFKIENEKLVGSGSLVFKGYNRSNLLSQLGDATNKKRFENIKSIVLKANNKFKLLDYSEENIKDRDKPYIINYSFDIENYLIKIDKDIYLNLNVDTNFDQLAIEKDRVSKFEIDFLSDSQGTYELEIPQNYSVKYLPKDLVFENELLSASFKYQTKDNKVIYVAKITPKKILLEKSDFELWNESIKKIKSNYGETIIITQK
jgi:transglutaminase-like putative cysteine protease